MAQLIDALVGHAEIKTWLLAQAGNASLPSTLIFHGPQGVGKKTLALALLQVMNCREVPLACGQCSSCRRIPS